MCRRQSRERLRIAVGRFHNTFSQKEISKQTGNKKILPEQPLKELCVNKLQGPKVSVIKRYKLAKSILTI
jgi:hypothetical protein